MNKVVLIGRLTADPEIRQTQNGKSVANYRLAVERNFKQEGQPDADFINCVVWGKGADFASRYLYKGIKIAVEGRIQTGSYKRDDGSTAYTTDVIVAHHEFCESKKSGDPMDALAAKVESHFGNGDFSDIDDNEDTLPF